VQTLAGELAQRFRVPASSRAEANVWRRSTNIHFFPKKLVIPSISRTQSPHFWLVWARQSKVGALWAHGAVRFIYVEQSACFVLRQSGGERS
jgi:hypothetical protein